MKLPTLSLRGSPRHWSSAIAWQSCPLCKPGTEIDRESSKAAFQVRLPEVIVPLQALKVQTLNV